MKSILLLGSTGSIGTQTLDLVERSRGELRVEALCAARSWERLLEQVHHFRPRVVGMADPVAAERLAEHLPRGVSLRVGPRAPEELAAEANYELAVHGMVGAAGVRPSQRILERGKTLALANKESLVVAGAPLMELSRSRNAPIVPVDSEHSALMQCLRDEPVERVRHLYLTASGGPFRDLPLDAFRDITPAMALRHPNWDMGPRISVGSATLMNKALEVLEAHHLFGVDADAIRVVLHRESIVHSMVEFIDGSVLAQMGPPDMRVPLHVALHWPDRAPSNLPGFQPELFRTLHFEDIDPARFPTLELGYRCIRAGGASGAVLNAADEVAVQAFLDGRIPFQDIERVNRTVLEDPPAVDDDVEGLLEADRLARAAAERLIESLPSPVQLP